MTYRHHRQDSHSGQRSSQQQPHDGAAGGDCGVDPKRATSFPPGGERHIERGQRCGRQDCGEDALRCPRGNQHAEADGGTADGRRRGEAEQSDKQGAAPAQDVRQPPADEQQCTEGQRVRGDDPLAAFGAEAQRALRRRQCDVHDRRVEDHHELGKSDDDEDSPGMTASRPWRSGRRSGLSVGALQFGRDRDAGNRPGRRVVGVQRCMWPLPHPVAHVSVIRDGRRSQCHSEFPSDGAGPRAHGFRT